MSACVRSTHRIVIEVERGWQLGRHGQGDGESLCLPDDGQGTPRTGHCAEGARWLGAGHPTVVAATFAVVPRQRREQSGMRRFVAGVPLRAERQTAAGERFELNASLRASTIRYPYEHGLR